MIQKLILQKYVGKYSFDICLRKNNVYNNYDCKKHGLDYTLLFVCCLNFQ